MTALSCCPVEFGAHQRWHAVVKLDATLASPSTEHGTALRSSRRLWPEAGPDGQDMWLGECACGSSLMFHTSFQEQANAAPSGHPHPEDVAAASAMSG